MAPLGSRNARFRCWGYPGIGRTWVLSYMCTNKWGGLGKLIVGRLRRDESLAGRL